MAAPRLLERELFFRNVLRIWLCFASRCRQITLDLLYHGWDLDVKICAIHCVFASKRKFRCGENLARLLDGCGRRRFAVESASELKVPGDSFSSL